jgi:hypothetical protein
MFNLKDFPVAILSSHDIIAQPPDEFIAGQLDLHPWRVLGAIEAIQNRLKKPPVSFDEYLAILVQQGLPTSVEILRQLC